MGNDWLSIADVERETNIPNRSIRRYINQHGIHLVVKKEHRSYLVSPNSLPTLLKIRDLYAAGKTGEQVENVLAESSIPVTITMDESERQVTMGMSDALMELRRAMSESLSIMAEEQKKMSQEINRLRSELAATQETLDEQEEKRIHAELERDKALADLKNEVVELKQKEWSTLTIDDVKTAMSTQPKSLWQRMFGKK